MDKVKEKINKEAKAALFEYYKTHDRDDRRELIAIITMECGVSIHTVNRWIYNSEYKVKGLFGERILLEIKKLSEKKQLISELCEK